jgi:hypothetical protein
MSQLDITQVAMLYVHILDPNPTYLYCTPSRCYVVGADMFV